jgi:hypothetical protein
MIGRPLFPLFPCGELIPGEPLADDLAHHDIEAIAVDHLAVVTDSEQNNSGSCRGWRNRRLPPATVCGS